MTRLDRAGAFRTGLALAAVSGLFLVKGLAVHQAGDPVGSIIPCLLIFWRASRAAMGIGVFLESRIAVLTIGLDSGVGVLHHDLRARGSLACDLMEPVRPKVDGLVLDLLRTHPFADRDLFETRQGVCRVPPGARG